MKKVLVLAVVFWCRAAWAQSPTATPTVAIDTTVKSTHVTALEMDNLTSHAPVPIDETSTRVTRCSLYIKDKALWGVCNDGTRWQLVAAPS